jgi:AraC-like DNA-binding protein
MPYLTRERLFDGSFDISVVSCHLVPRDDFLYDAGQRLRIQASNMAPASSNTSLPVTAGAVVQRYANHFQSLGAPVEKLLEHEAICPDRLEIPGFVVPLQKAFRFAELACQSLQAEHLALGLGSSTSIQDFGSYGCRLQVAPTLGKYLEHATALFNIITTGERLLLSECGNQIRLNIASPGKVGLGMHQSHLGIIGVTISVCRKVLGPSWSPEEVGFAYRSREKIPSVDLFSDSRIISGLPHSYISIPKAATALRLHLDTGATDIEDQETGRLPTTLRGLIETQIEALITAGAKFHIETVADSLMMSKRTLQRAIAYEGLNYFQLLSDVRLRKAMDWLDRSDKPVTEIAFALGYTDVSNFSRAFRRHTGISPRAYRKASLHRTPEQPQLAS